MILPLSDVRAEEEEGRVNAEKKWRYKEDCSVIRTDSDYYIKEDGRAVLMDCDGIPVFDVPDTWTDEQIFQCLEIANKAYGRGFNVGQLSKAHEIARALYLNK